jgi:hypothetical protein
MSDPSRVDGSEAERLAAFRATARRLEERVRALLATRAAGATP